MTGLKWVNTTARPALAIIDAYMHVVVVVRSALISWVETVRGLNACWLELYVSHWTRQFVRLRVRGPWPLNPASGWCAFDGIIFSVAFATNRADYASHCTLIAAFVQWRNHIADLNSQLFLCGYCSSTSSTRANRPKNLPVEHTNCCYFMTLVTGNGNG